MKPGDTHELTHMELHALANASLGIQPIYESEGVYSRLGLLGLLREVDLNRWEVTEMGASLLTIPCGWRLKGMAEGICAEPGIPFLEEPKLFPYPEERA